MSKKNNRGKDQRYIAFLIEREKQQAARKAELKQRKENARVRAEEKSMDAKRKATTRKPKVAPVIGSKVKLDKMSKKQMQALSIGSGAKTSAAAKAKKLNMEDDEDSEDDQDMQGVTNAVPRMAASSKNRISKHRDGISRATEVQLKKDIRRRLKMGTKEARKDAKKMRRRLMEGLEKRRETTERLNAEAKAVGSDSDDMSD